MKCKISVIVPVFRGEKTLRKCVQSIMKQTYENLEIILVDDGSPDESPHICDELKQEDKRIVVLHKANGGQAEARNFGIEISTGDYIGFVDDDDYIEPTMYERLLKNAIDNDVLLSCCANYMTYIDGSEENRFVEMHSGIYESEVFIYNILFQNKTASGAVWNKLISRSVIEDVVFPVGSQYEDYSMMIRLMYKVRKLYFDDTPLYHWVQNPLSQSKRAFFPGQWSGIDVARGLKKFFVNNNAPDNLVYACEYFELIVRHRLIRAMNQLPDKENKKLMTNELREMYRLLWQLVGHRTRVGKALRMCLIDTYISIAVRNRSWR
ncbi:MAG: glycosyltransferase [Lachnospiraceae bacterium]|nr:glycosyltransferase [Lachnospiraceae bacterium]